MEQVPPQHTRPCPHSASRVQTPHCAPVQTWPPVHSAPGQQAPAVQVPPQQTRPAPHWAFEVQAWQAFWRHCVGAGHSASEQHSPDRQPPLQHFESSGHSASLVHAMDAACARRAVQRPSLHAPPGPQSASARQAPHRWPTQAAPPQVELSQQSPATHAPPQHRCPAPHSESSSQAPQVRPTQASPALQSALVQHAPARQSPPQQTSPWPHCVPSTHGWHVCSTHTRPSQSAVAQQSPMTHRPSQHRSSPRQSNEVLQAAAGAIGRGCCSPGATGRDSAHAANHQRLKPTQSVRIDSPSGGSSDSLPAGTPRHEKSHRPG